MNRLILRDIFAGVLGVALAFTVGYVVLTREQNQLAEEPQTSATSRTLASVGELVENVGYSITLVGRSFTDGDAIFMPGTDYHFLVSEVSITNTGTDSFYLAPVTQFSVQDARGELYRMAPSTLVKPLESGELKPGETIRGQVSFEIPRDATGMVLLYNPTPLRASVSSIGL